MGSVQFWELIGEGIATNMKLNACICAKQHKRRWLSSLTCLCYRLLGLYICTGYLSDLPTTRICCKQVH